MQKPQPQCRVLELLTLEDLPIDDILTSTHKDAQFKPNFKILCCQQCCAYKPIIADEPLWRPCITVKWVFFEGREHQRIIKVETTKESVPFFDTSCLAKYLRSLNTSFALPASRGYTNFCTADTLLQYVSPLVIGDVALNLAMPYRSLPICVDGLHEWILTTRMFMGTVNFRNVNAPIEQLDEPLFELSCVLKDYTVYTSEPIKNIVTLHSRRILDRIWINTTGLCAVLRESAHLRMVGLSKEAVDHFAELEQIKLREVLERVRSEMKQEYCYRTHILNAILHVIRTRCSNIVTSQVLQLTKIARVMLLYTPAYWCDHQSKKLLSSLNRSITNTTSSNLCPLCFAHAPLVVLIPCGHLLCGLCAFTTVLQWYNPTIRVMSSCPFCRTQIDQISIVPEAVLLTSGSALHRWIVAVPCGHVIQTERRDQLTRCSCSQPIASKITIFNVGPQRFSSPLDYQPYQIIEPEDSTIADSPRSPSPEVEPTIAITPKLDRKKITIRNDIKLVHNNDRPDDTSTAGTDSIVTVETIINIRSANKSVSSVIANRTIFTDGINTSNRTVSIKRQYARTEAQQALVEQPLHSQSSSQSTSTLSQPQQQISEESINDSYALSTTELYSSQANQSYPLRAPESNLQNSCPSHAIESGPSHAIESGPSHAIESGPSHAIELCLPPQTNELHQEERINELHQEERISELHQEERISELHQEERINESHQEERINESNQEERINESNQGEIINESHQGVRINESNQGERINESYQGARINPVQEERINESCPEDINGAKSNNTSTAAVTASPVTGPVNHSLNDGNIHHDEAANLRSYSPMPPITPPPANPVVASAMALPTIDNINTPGSSRGNHQTRHFKRKTPSSITVRNSRGSNASSSRISVTNVSSSRTDGTDSSTYNATTTTNSSTPTMVHTLYSTAKRPRI